MQYEKREIEVDEVKRAVRRLEVCVCGGGGVCDIQAEMKARRFTMVQ